MLSVCFVVQYIIARTKVHRTVKFCVQLLVFIFRQVEKLIHCWNILVNIKYNVIDIDLLKIKINLVKIKNSRIIGRD